MLIVHNLLLNLLVFITTAEESFVLRTAVFPNLLVTTLNIVLTWSSYPKCGNKSNNFISVILADIGFY